MEKRYKFEKLVRDRAVAIMQEYSSDIKYKKIISKEYGKELFHEKFLEEIQEVFEAKTKEELAVELADVIEVIYGYGKLMNIDKTEIENARLKKNEERGAFQEAFYVHSVKLDNQHPMAIYLQKDPSKYPEISD